MDGGNLLTSKLLSQGYHRAKLVSVLKKFYSSLIPTTWPLVNLVLNGHGRNIRSLPVVSLLAVPRRLFCFGSLVILDVARCYSWLFSLYINIKIGKNSCYMLN